jgi:peptidylprolyl isomerase
VLEKQGDGPKVTLGKRVTVHYTGYLLNGTKFDSSVDRNQPFSFNVGIGQVIQGWDEGLMLLNVGSKAKLIIPSYMGYGEGGAGNTIPPNAILVFDVEVLGVE